MNHKHNRGNKHNSGKGNGGGRPASHLQAIHAPYNFVPLHDRIFKPEWGPKVSHDKPFRDGLCGELRIEIEAHTPVLVGNEHVAGSKDRPGEVHFHKAPDGRYMIPGSSLRGMIRSVLEIAAFGRMRFVDDTRMSIRDLAGPAKEVYRKAIAGNVQSAWLQRGSDGKWQLHPCEHAKVKHQELIEFHGDGFDAGRRASARDRYNRWGQSLRVSFDIKKIKTSDIAVNLGRGRHQGTIVLTGQPGPNKKADFIFYGDKNTSITLSDQCMRDFFLIHSGDEENNTWLFWKRRAMSGERVPVFYIRQGERYSLGLAGMFRLAYKHSIHQTIAHSSKEHIEDKGDDLPALIFGHTDKDKGLGNLKGRVSFTPAFATGNPEPVSTEPTILNGPKPSYYPNYIEQTQSGPGKLDGDAYQTFMDNQARIRGFKRYPARPQAQVQALTADQMKNKKVQVKLHPLPRGTRFTTRLKFHNLRPVELGAVIWALTWGGNNNLRHSIGMGKPFGFGQISCRISAVDIRPNDASMDAPELDKCIEAFKACMQAAIPSWEKSPQLTELLAMADPAKAAGKKLTHMRLRSGRRNNEFVEAKNRKLVLAPYTGALPRTHPRPARQAEAKSGAGQGSPRPQAQQGAQRNQRQRLNMDEIKQRAKKATEHSPDAPVKGEQHGEIIAVQDGSMRVRLKDGQIINRPAVVEHTKPSQIRVGMKVILRGKGVYPANLPATRNAGAAGRSSAKPNKSTGSVSEQDLRKLASRFKVVKK